MNIEDRLRRMFGAARDDRRASEAEWQDFARRGHRTLFVRRTAAGIGAASLVAIAVVGAVTLTSDDGFRTAPAPAGSPTAPPENTPEPQETQASTIEVPESEQELWYVQDGRLSWSATVGGGEEISAELAPPDDPVAQKAAFWLRFLLREIPGPVVETGGETAIPKGTELLGVVRDGSELTVHLKTYFDGSQDTEKSLELAMAQIVYTATQFEGIDSVSFRLKGGADETLTGSRFYQAAASAEAFTRRDFKGVAPAIVLEAPKPGAELSGSAEVTGFANVFEATVNIELVDRFGKKLVETFTTATCGSGCWGDFTETIEFEVDRRQTVRLTVLTYSAEDGSPQDQISIPVTLVP